MHRSLAIVGLLMAVVIGLHAQTVRQSPTLTTHSSCSIHANTFEGWPAQEIANDWLRVTIVPQLGGRLMQVSFDGHAYLFVNPKYKGKYVSPAEAAGSWINYGGDKIWPMPEGENDERHWVLQSSPLDDGAYAATVISRDGRCSILLEGPPDPETGLQYSRTIGIGSDSPEISFHAVMKNITGHAVEWSVQSVTQYNLSDGKSPGEFNRDFWAFTPVNPASAYPEGFHVRIGLADDPSFQVSDGLFRLHWLYLQNEVWVDSTAGWLATIDNTSGYAMVEQFDYLKSAEYPGKATVIFYKNGPAVEMDENLRPQLKSSTGNTPYYMEAEINSPFVQLRAGENYAMDTNWFPTRMGRELSAVTEAGVIGSAFAASRSAKGIVLSGSFGIFFPGKLQAYLYDSRGVRVSEVVLQSVRPQDAVRLQTEIAAPTGVVRISLHVIDDHGVDRGSGGETTLSKSN